MLFERKTENALKEALQAEDQKLVELSRVVEDPATGLDVGEWEINFQTSVPDVKGMYTFIVIQVIYQKINTLYRIVSYPQNHIDKQFKCLSQTLGVVWERRRGLNYI